MGNGRTEKLSLQLDLDVMHTTQPLHFRTREKKENGDGLRGGSAPNPDIGRERTEGEQSNKGSSIMQFRL